MYQSNQNLIQHDLRAGKGKVIRFLLTQEFGRYQEIILGHCLHNQAYDPQCEGSRAQYLYPLIQDKADLQEIILKALPETTDGFDREQLLEFAVLFAKEGSYQARNVLYEIIESVQSSNEFTSTEHLKDQKEAEDLLCILGLIGSDQSHLRDDLIRLAEEKLRIEPVQQALGHSIKKQSIIQTPEPDQMELMKNLTWEELISRPNDAKLRAQWAHSASELELTRAAMDIVSEEDPIKLERSLRIFRKRPFPLNVQFLIDLVDHPSLKITQTALDALKIIKHPDVRALAEKLFECHGWESDAISLLQLNYQAGDHLQFKKLIELVSDPDDLHSLEIEIVRVYQENVDLNGAEILLFLYEKNLCSICREDSVRLLHRWNLLPSAILEDCAYDCADGLRQLATDLSTNPNPT